MPQGDRLPIHKYAPAALCRVPAYIGSFAVGSCAAEFLLRNAVRPIVRRENAGDRLAEHFFLAPAENGGRAGHPGRDRSEERRVGKEGVGTSRSRGSPYH